jgi:hypothetical protein
MTVTRYSGKAVQKIITLAMAAWFPDLNSRRTFDENGKEAFTVFDPKDSTTNALIESIKDRGYDPQYPCVVGPITDEQKARAVKERQEEWESLKAIAHQPAAPKDAMANLIEFEFNYVSRKGKKEEVIAPEFLGCTGNRRSMCVRHAQRRLLLDPKNSEALKSDEGTKSLLDIRLYALYEEFKDDDQRLMRQLSENTAKTEGFKNLSILEVMYSVRSGVEAGRISQADLREAYKDGEGQRLYGFLVLNARFPGLKLMQRLHLPDSNPDQIVYSSLPQGGKEGFSTVVRRSDEYTLNEYNKKQIAAGGDIEGFMDQNAVDLWFRTVRDRRKNATKMMDKTGIQQLQNANPVIAFKKIAEDILSNKHGNIEKYTAGADAINGVTELLGKPEFQSVTDVIASVHAIPEGQGRVDYVEFLKTVCHAYTDEALRAKVLKALK